jgi:hypothetical protein
MWAGETFWGHEPKFFTNFEEILSYACGNLEEKNMVFEHS